RREERGDAGRDGKDLNRGWRRYHGWRTSRMTGGRFRTNNAHHWRRASEVQYENGIPPSSEWAWLAVERIPNQLLFGSLRWLDVEVIVRREPLMKNRVLKIRDCGIHIMTKIVCNDLR